MSRHRVVSAPSRRDREHAVAEADLPPPLIPVIDAHRRLRGPYTAGGAIARAAAKTASPDLLARYDLELSTVAPELRATIPVGRETLFNRVRPEERTRVHSSLRTLRIAHGFADFLRAWGGGGTSLVIENLDEADETDRELFTVLLRRLDPASLTLVLCTAEPAGRWPHAEPLVTGASEAYVAGERAPSRDRERDTPPGAAVQALADAQDHCFTMAFHHACADYGRRGRALTEPGTPEWWRFTRQMALSLTLLGEGERSEALYEEARAASEDPAVHRVTAYEIAMLYARHHAAERRDLKRALASINEAIAIASLLGDEDDRAFYEIFYRNGKALITMRLGDASGALRMVDEGIARMDREFPPERHPLDRCTLLSNRARLLAVLGENERARKAYDDLIAIDPDYAEYHFDRAELLHAMGLHEQALADYDTAVRLGPPFAEMHHNRAVLRQEIGDVTGALEDLSRVLELDPADVDAYVNRAGLRAATGDETGAEADVRDGLALDPGNPHLTCVRGQLTAAVDPDRARADFDAALAAEPGLVAALAGRAALTVDADPDEAVADLTRALASGEDATLLFNRAVAHRSAGHLNEARADLTHALTLCPDDADAIDLRKELS